MQYTSRIIWNRNSKPFDTKSYDRTHYIHLGSGFSIEASSAPEFAGNAQLPNPEELFISSISSCLMLTFLYLAAMKGWIIDEYNAEAVGILAKNQEGKMAVTEVTIKPKISFYENRSPDPNMLAEVFQKAHDHCFISSSVKSKIHLQPEIVSLA